MKLIREEIESVEFLVENRNGKKSMYIEGVFLQGNIKNRNGRMYPMETLRREVGRYNENHSKALLLQNQNHRATYSSFLLYMRKRNLTYF